jgi:putative aldouronate transport system substrate-binding protein
MCVSMPIVRRQGGIPSKMKENRNGVQPVSAASPRPRLRVISAATAVLAASLALAACTSGGASSGSSNPNEPSAVTMFGATNPGVRNMNTDWTTQFVENKFHLKITWDLSADPTTSQPLLFSSGDYPDVIFDGVFTNVQLEQYGEQEHILVPLNSLLKKYAPNAWNAINTLPGYKSEVTAPDGNIYGLPLYNYCFHCEWPYNFYINVGLLNQYGLSMPTTTAQLAHVLAVFKQHGVTAPLTGAVNGMLAGSSESGYNMDVITFLMNSFVPYDGTGDYFGMNGNTVAFVPDEPGWRAGLEYLHQLYAAGDFSESVFTQQDTQVENLIANNQVGVVPNGAIQTAIPNYGLPGSHYQDWAPLAPLAGPSGARYAAFGGAPGGGAIFAITSKTPLLAQERVMQLVNYLYTPTGTQTVQFGPEGKYWTNAAKGQDGLIPQQALFDTDWGSFDLPNLVQNEGWSQWGPQDQSFDWRELDHLSPPYSTNGGEALDQLVEAADYAGLQAKWHFPYGGSWVPAADAENYATETTNIDNYVGQWAEGFIVGSKSLASDWSSYVSGLNSLGLAQYLSMTQQSITGPLNADIPFYEASPGDVKYLLTEGPVPPLVQKYMIEDGVPASDFAK